MPEVSGLQTYDRTHMPPEIGRRWLDGFLNILEKSPQFKAIAHSAKTSS
jgi:hypothetical protein